MNIARILTKNGDRFPQKLAIVDKEKQCSYQTFNFRVNRIGNTLSAIGIEKADKVVLLMSRRNLFLAFDERQSSQYREKENKQCYLKLNF
jgi:non-ribosomal peptide synthetase component E (peptide arylation enzyme)